MHYVWLERLRPRVAYVNLKLRRVALVHVVKLQHVFVGPEVAELIGVAARVVFYLGKHHSPHREVYGFL